jgi:hypothetical protein
MIHVSSKCVALDLIFFARIYAYTSMHVHTWACKLAGCNHQSYIYIYIYIYIYTYTHTYIHIACTQTYSWYHNTHMTDLDTTYDLLTHVTDVHCVPLAVEQKNPACSLSSAPCICAAYEEVRTCEYLCRHHKLRIPMQTSQVANTYADTTSCEYICRHHKFWSMIICAEHHACLPRHHDLVTSWPHNHVTSWLRDLMILFLVILCCCNMCKSWRSIVYVTVNVWAVFMRAYDRHAKPCKSHFRLFASKLCGYSTHVWRSM